VPEGRVAEGAAALELPGQEAGDVVPRGVLDRARLRLERLDEDAAGRVAAAAARELGEELERPLLGAEVGQAEPRVGIDDRSGLADAAVVAAKRPVAMQREGDVAVRAAARGPTGAAVESGRDTAPVEQQDSLASSFREPPQLGEKRRGERIAGLVPQVDDANRRQRRGDPAAEL